MILRNEMAETQEITTLYVVTDSETSYDKIGDIDGGMIDQKWLEAHIESHGADGLIKRLVEMITVVNQTDREIMRKRYADRAGTPVAVQDFMKKP